MKYGTFPPGWWFEVKESGGQTMLLLTGPEGAAASFPVASAGVRAEVLRMMIKDISAETEAK
jgi:hypothetical protein